MQEEQYYEEPGVSLMTILKVGFGRKILFLIIAGVLALVSFFSVHFIYTKNKVEYTASYNNHILAIEGGKYMDGSNFIIQDIVSLENLKTIRDSKEEYKGIDVEKIVEKNAITLENVVEKDKDTEVEKSYYTLTVKAKYFPSVDVAKAFFKDVMETPLNKTKTLAGEMKYTTNLSIYATANSYERKIAALENQVDYLNEKYTNLISTYGDLEITIDGETKAISLYKNEINEYFGVYNISALYSQIRKNGYVYQYDKYKNELDIQLTNVEKNLELNQKKIDAISAERTALINEATAAGVNLQVLDLSAYNSTLNELNLERVDLEYTKEILEKKINDGKDADTTAFDATLNNYYENLVALTQTYKTISTKVISDNNSIIYMQSSGIQSQGGLSIIIELVLSVFIGVIVAFVVNLILDHDKLKEDYVKVVVPQNEEVKPQ